MKKPENFNAGATVKPKTDPLAEAISNNFVKQEVPSDSATKMSSAVSKTKANREVKEKFLVSMSKGERSLFKSFCALNNVSMNHFVMCAMDYFKEDIENGKVTISPHSYKRMQEI